MHAKRRLIAAAAAILTFASIAHAEVRPIEIGDDEGGVVDVFLMWYGRVRDSGVPVRVKGLCQSACTLVLSLPPEQVCIETTASLGFHLFAYGGVPSLNRTQAYMRRYYPVALQTALGKFKLSRDMIFIPAAEIVNLGVMRACEPQGDDQ